MEAIIILVVIVVAVVIVAGAFKNAQQINSNTQNQTVRTISCPNCGSPATLRGKNWECGWCGDFGAIK